ncbi:FxSxx-COOH system tetratricopeptide repeat protein [Marinactinospora thermotolerans]|uniref:FxSxx-COOH system tetratricopeptide repeat protein n=1 Tax=Marinactinospora thermotolerans TaxID=531310 RepID=UPI001F1792A3|nr:FxSxx-COOH system tetratricopeptide repeat protein [Marinactinospora thermotolerans]
MSYPQACPASAPQWWEVADALWLAAVRDAADPASPTRSPDPAPSDAPADPRPPAPRPRPLGDEGTTGEDPASAPPERPAPEAEETRPTRPDPPPPVPPASGPAGASPATPVESVLRRPQALVRALRAFRRLRPGGQRLDESRTAQRYAELALAAPETARAGRTPLLPVLSPDVFLADELTLLVDDSLSMMLHRPLVREFTDLVRQVRVFGEVRLVRFDSDKTFFGEVPLKGEGAADPAPTLPAHGPGRHVVLVLSDALGFGWHSGAVQSWLARWGRDASVGLVQVMERHQWRRTTMRLHRVALRASVPARGASVPNARYRVAHLSTLPIAPAARSDEAEIRGLAVPVLALEPEDIGRWARFLAGRGDPDGFRCSALIVEDAVEETAAWDEEDALASREVTLAARARRRAAPLNADQRIERFRAAASPTAFQLAVYLAAVPLNLPIIRGVQRRFAPASRSTDLAEVLWSDLVDRIGDDDISRPDRVALDFHPGVRERLLALGGRRSQITELIGSLAEEHRDSVPWLSRLTPLLRQPDAWRPPEVDAATEPFARAVIPALQALSGYVRRAATDWAERIGPSSPAPVEGRGEEAASPSADAPEQPADDHATAQRGPIPDPPVSAPVGTPENGLPPTIPEGDSVTDVLRSLTAQRSADRGASPTIWGQIPPRNRTFVGRELLLEELRRRLREGTTALVPQTLQGMGGVGKTQLAMEYAHRNRAEYDLVWWIPSETSAQVQQALIDLAVRLGVGSSNDPAAAVRAALEALRLGAPIDNWLLIYDNAGDPEELQGFLPTDGPGQLLITSRSPRWRAGDNSLLEVDTFERAESKELLHKRGPKTLTDDEADRIAERLGDLPLAVEQTAVWLLETLMPATEWLEVFDEKADELLANLGPSPDYPRSVAATMNMTLDRLSETNPGALQLLRVCAFLAPQPIPRKLFNGARNVDAPPELTEILADPAIKLSRALRAIDRYALVKMDHRNETFQLHRLVQEALRIPLSPREREEVLHCAHMLLANLDPGDPFAIREWGRYVELLPHVQATRQWRCDSDWARQLVLGELHFLSLWGGYQEGHDLGLEVLEEWRRRLGEDHVQTLRAAMRYAEILRELGRFEESYELCTRTVETLTRTSGPDDEETLDAHAILSWDLRNIGEFQRAVEVSTDSLERHERIFGRDDPLTLRAAHLHAVGLRLNGRFDEAMRIDRYNYEIRVEILGPEHALTNGSRYGYGMNLMESGRYREAAVELEAIHTLNNRIRERQSPSRLVTMQAVGTVKRRLGLLEEALELTEEAWQLSHQRLGPASPGTMRAAANHSVSLRAAGAHDAALRLSEDSLNRFRDLYGEHHPLYADVALNHAVVLRLLGRAAEARRLDEEALAVHVDRLGEDHPSTIANAINLASDLFATGQVAAALEMDTTTLDRCRRAFPENHPLTLAALRNLVLDRQAIEGSTLSEETDDVIRRYATVFGPDHPSTLSAAENVRANCDLHINDL